MGPEVLRCLLRQSFAWMNSWQFSFSNLTMAEWSASTGCLLSMELGKSRIALRVSSAVVCSPSRAKDPSGFCDSQI